MTKAELAYCAGIIDGEGYIGIKRTRPGERADRKTPGFHARIVVRMVRDEAVLFLVECLGGTVRPHGSHAKRGRPLMNWQVTDRKAEQALRLVLPYLRVKRENAVNVLALRELQAEGAKYRTKIIGERRFVNQHGTVRMVPTKVFSDEYVARCSALWARGKELNARGI